MSEQERPLEERITEVERELENAQARIPKHSPPVSLLIEIDEAEDELAELRKQQGS